MKAIRVHRFGEPEVLQLEEVSDLRPGPGQVVVRVKAAGVNPVDTYIRAGAYTKPPVPYTPGFDGAGLVDAVGEGVKRVKPGDRVYIAGSITGTYAELALCDAAQVHPLPAPISFAQGAAVGIPYVTAYRSLFHCGRAQAGEVVFVHGASGGVGIAAVQLARAAGMTVIGTGGTEKGRALVAREGAHHVLDHKLPDYVQEVLALADGRGVDVILEMLANEHLGQDLGLLARGGRVVVIGCRGNVEINPREVMIREASIVGMVVFNASARELAGIHAALVAGLESGTLRPIVGKEMPLADAPSAHRAVMEPGAYGKVVLIP
jgi:NADPH2:quinone reductase